MFHRRFPTLAKLFRHTARDAQRADVPFAAEGRRAAGVLAGLLTLVLPIVGPTTTARAASPAAPFALRWERLPDYPLALGVAGAFSGVHNGALIVAGGANFPEPVWENDKVWHDEIFVLTRGSRGYQWQSGGRLPFPIAYGSSVSTPQGVICMGGNNAERTFADVFLLRWDVTRQQVEIERLPELPAPRAHAGAAVLDGTVYLVGGQAGRSLDTATADLWAMKVGEPAPPARHTWETLPSLPGPPRAFHLTLSQHNGFHNALYVISGRHASGASPSSVGFLQDVWEFVPTQRLWRQRSDAPVCVMAGSAAPLGQSHIFVLGGADGSLFGQADRLGDAHPGFPLNCWAYHTITDSWSAAGETPQNLVTTSAIPWENSLVIPSGEVRPRVRSPHVWRVYPERSAYTFGAFNYAVLVGYLLSMVGIGFYFARSNRNTNDYFRGGQHVPWWAAGCSIFATMLSSLTFTGIPSKSFAQDWVYAIGNFMIPVVAVVAVYVALPFFRRIDATSAYEYLEKRFNRAVRLFGSGSFTLFHVFRMAVVMSLTGLALAVATPLTPVQSVTLMGVLSIIYCTLGGIEAVIWTDTIQTVVLLGGAALAFAFMLSGVADGWSGFFRVASTDDKFRIANFHWDVTDAQIAIWVVIIGGIAQNLSSYTADQAVVQRYMTTATANKAARSIWTNAALTIPTTFLFFALGTGLYAFYHSHPEKLDPTITTDQIFPFFISREMPMGVAGIIVAGIFAAAQSTVSTSMNSIATTVVTDFMRPLNLCRSESGYLRAARWWTIAFGVAGTVLGVVFVNPEIRSLFDAFIKIIGLFMGVLGGLFILGAVSRRANATGAATGAFVGAIVMLYLWRFTEVNGYLYTACGIVSCVVVGYLTSRFVGSTQPNLRGLTLYTLDQPIASNPG
jgi:SSS family transporter